MNVSTYGLTRVFTDYNIRNILISGCEKPDLRVTRRLSQFQSVSGSPKGEQAARSQLFTPEADCFFVIMSYTKLASAILTSTVWMEDDHTRIVWLTLLAMADKNGEVQASIPGLANIARVPVESTRVAISKFLSPDPDSRTKDDEGRRIEEIPGGWYLINHGKYRELYSDEDRKRKNADRQARSRARKKKNSAEVTPRNAEVTPRNAEVTPRNAEVTPRNAEVTPEFTSRDQRSDTDTERERGPQTPLAADSPKTTEGTARSLSGNEFPGKNAKKQAVTRFDELRGAVLQGGHKNPAQSKPDGKASIPDAESPEEKPWVPSGQEPQFAEIPSFDEVQLHFERAGLGPSVARKFFNKWDAVGWQMNGQRIRKWQGLASNFMTVYRENDQGSRGLKTPKTVSPVMKEIQRLIDAG